MTIENILNEIYQFEDMLAYGNNEKTTAMITALCCVTKIIARHSLLDENIYNGIDVERMNDEDLKLYADWLHNEKIFADRELYKRHIF